MSRMPVSRTIPGLVNEQARTYAQRPALVGSGHRLNYSELQQEVLKVARRLHRLGVGPGDKVAILMGNKPEWITSALAIVSLGATMVSLNTWATLKELEYLIKHSDSKYLITVPSFLKSNYERMLQELEPLAERFPMLRGVLGVGETLPKNWAPLLDDATDRDTSADDEIARAYNAVGQTDIAFLLYTSGSTSAPKGVQVQHNGLIENPWHIGERQHVTESDRLWLAVSLFWGLGCENAMMNLLTHGGCIVLQESFDAGEALRLIEQERCTLFYGMANMAQAMHEHPDRAMRDISSLRGGMTGGTREQVRRVVELGATQICNVYGMTETYGNSHVTDANDDLERRLTSQGKPLPGVQQRIVSPDGVEVAVGTVGELRIKGYVTPGYYKDEALTAQSFDEQGFFKTGDLVSEDEDGYLHFHGRLKEMLKSGGINVSPAEVEKVLMAYPGVQLAQVVGVPDATRDEIVGAVIVPKPDTTLNADEIMTYCRTNMAAYKVPRLLRIIEEAELPLTTTGKIQKNRIAAKFFPPQ